MHVISLRERFISWNAREGECEALRVVLRTCVFVYSLGVIIGGPVYELVLEGLPGDGCGEAIKRVVLGVLLYEPTLNRIQRCIKHPVFDIFRLGDYLTTSGSRPDLSSVLRILRASDELYMKDGSCSLKS